jgi:hypothetical protein
MNDSRNARYATPRSPLDTLFNVFDRLTSPLTLLGGAGLVLGGWSTYAFGMPIYAAVIGLALGLVGGLIYRVFGSFF